MTIGKMYKKCELCASLIPLDDNERVADAIKPRLCEKCIRDGWKYTEHGVLMNETPVKKRKKKDN